MIDQPEIDYHILKRLMLKKGRTIDIARDTNINDKTTWQALRRLTQLGYVKKDEFDVYEITEEGKRKVSELSKNESYQRKVVLAALARRSEELDKKDFENLMNMMKKLEEKEKSK